MSEHEYTSLGDYYRLLANSHLFLILWIGQVINELGGWFNLVACYKLVQDLTGKVGVSLSILLIIRSAPKLLWFMFAGAVADSFNRAWVLVVSSILQGLLLLLFPLCHHASSLWLLYVLVFLQRSVATVYDPAKSALIPTLVPPGQLHLAATLDSFAWSLMAALGACLGGFAAAYFGTTTCFLIDAATFFVSAALSIKLISHAHIQSYSAPSKSDPAHQGALGLEGTEDGDLEDQSEDAPLIPAGRSPTPKPKAALNTAEVIREHEHDQLLGGRETFASRSASLGLQFQHEAAPPVLSLGLLLRKGLAAVHAGMSYLAAPENRDVAVLTLMKGCGGIAWGAADVLNAEFGNTKGVALSSGPSATVGLTYAAVGVGCIVGPVLVNHFTPSNPRGWLRSASLSFGVLSFGYVVMLPVLNLPMCLLGIIIRSSGSNTLWVYSTTLLQKRVDPASQGSVFAVEMALFTLGISASSLLAGELLGEGVLGVRGLVMVMGIISLVLMVVWCAYAGFGTIQVSAGGDSAEEAEQQLPQQPAPHQHLHGSLELSNM